jgi:hypothetical protein
MVVEQELAPTFQIELPITLFHSLEDIVTLLL